MVLIYHQKNKAMQGFSIEFTSALSKITVFITILKLCIQLDILWYDGQGHPRVKVVNIDIFQTKRIFCIF